MQQVAPALAFDAQPIAWKGLAGGDPAQVEGEIGELGEAAGFLVRTGDLEQPALGLAAGVLTGDAIEPALDAAGEPEVGRVDGEDERAIDNAAVEPIGENELHPLDATVARRAFLPLVDPGELMTPPMLAVADGGADDGRLQAGECAFQELVVAGAGLAADRAEKLVGREAQKAGSPQAEVFRLDELARGPDEHIGVPDGRHAVLGHGVDLDPDIAGLIEDRRDASGLGEGEERTLHQVALVARAGVARGDDKRVELAAFADSDGAARRHGRSVASADRVADGAGLDIARIRRRTASRLVGPGLKIIDCIDDAAA